MKALEARADGALRRRNGGAVVMVRSPSLLPRYSPAVAALRLFTSATHQPASALAEVIDTLLPLVGDTTAFVVPSARQGLLAHYVQVRERLGRGVVLLPAQVCPVVPAVIRAAGHEPRGLDGDGTLATPSPAEYSAALADSSAIGILVAPMSGYVQDGWAALLPELQPQMDVVVDLAQAPFSAAAFGHDFLSRADAVVFSFGVGKGFDTGGGLLLTRRTVSPSRITRRAGPAVAKAACRSAAIHVAIALGAYRALLPVVDRMSANDATVTPVEQMDIAIAGYWLERLPIVASEFERAAERSAALGRMAAVQLSCRSVEATCSGSARPLRQVLRLRPGIDRDAVVRALRAAGLDCAAAGEPFPEGDDSGSWPAAAALTKDAIRLPFLGRQSADEFRRAERILEKVLTLHGV